MAYSHSRLETFENCPMKYRLRYIEGIRTKRKSIEAFMGTRVHGALEKLYRDLRMSRLPPLRELEAYYLEQWNALCDDAVFVVRSEYGPEDYRETGLRCIRGYYRRYYPFDEGVAIWIERKTSIPMRDREGRTVDFTGIIDRLDDLGGGRYEIHDYKTSSALPTRQELERDRQLSLYQLAVEAAFPGAAGVELVWHYLFFDRELRLRRERAGLEAAASRAVDLVERIEAASEFPPRESALCDWCEVQEHCPKRKHIFMVERAPARELSADRGIRLVNEYAEWSGRKREAEARLKELREEALDFSACQDMDNLQGNGYVLRIARERQLKVPDAGRPEREELERLLKEGGAWDGVSDISAGRLASALDEGSLDEGLRDRVNRLVTWEETPCLRLRRGSGLD